MKKVLILLTMASLVVMMACRRENHSDTLKVGINYNKSTSNQKINVIRDATGAYINWTSSDQIKIVDNSSFSTVLTYKSANQDGTANFSLPTGISLADDYYAACYPSTASPSTTFTIPDYYEINPNNLSAYLNDNLLMYTQKLYEHGEDDRIELTPAMTVLELPLRVDTGTLIIDDITIYAEYDYTMIEDAFIKSATLPDMFTSSSITPIETASSITYYFPTALVIGTTPATIKLLIWSNEKCTVDKYYVYINRKIEDYFPPYFQTSIKSINNIAFKNTKYYTLPVLAIPKPTVGDPYQGGTVCSTYVDINNITHCYIYDGHSSFAPSLWLHAGQSFRDILTSTAVGTGMTNTNNILDIHGNAATTARICKNYTVNHFLGKKTYKNWFLPSLEEIKLIPLGYGPTCWTSSQDGSDSTKAYIYDFNTKSQSTANKKTAKNIMPMRYF